MVADALSLEELIEEVEYLKLKVKFKKKKKKNQDSNRD